MRTPGAAVTALLLTYVLVARACYPVADCESGTTVVLDLTSSSTGDLNIGACFPYLPQMPRNCSWLVRAADGYFPYVSTYVGPLCSINDHVAFYDGPNTSSPRLGTAYADQCFFNYGPIASSREMFITMSASNLGRPTDDPNNVLCGFSIDMLFSTTAPAYCSGTQAVSLPYGGYVFTEPPAPFGGMSAYRAGSSCAWLFTAQSPFDQIQISNPTPCFQLGDFLYLHDGANESAPLIAIVWDDPYGMSSYTTSGHQLFVRFVTQAGTTFGYEGPYLGLTVNNPLVETQCSGMTILNVTDDDLTADNIHKVAIPPMCLEANTAYTQQYDYRPGLSCQATLIVPAGKVIYGFVIQPSGHNLNLGCDDWFNISDASGLLLATRGCVPGFLAPAVISTDNILYLSFTSNTDDGDHVSGQRFEFYFDAVDPPLPCSGTQVLNTTIGNDIATVSPYVHALLRSLSAPSPCNLTLGTRPGSILNVYFCDVNMGPGDSLVIYDGASVNTIDFNLIQSFIPTNFLSRGNTVTISYHPTSVNGVRYSGVQLFVQETNPSLQCAVVADGHCFSGFYDVPEGFSAGPYHSPLARNMDCVRTFDNAPDGSMLLVVTSMSFTELDYVVIYDGNSTGAPVLANFTYQPTDTFYSSGPYVTIHVHTGPDVGFSHGYPSDMGVVFYINPLPTQPAYCAYTPVNMTIAGEAVINIDAGGYDGGHRAGTCRWLYQVAHPSSQHMLLSWSGQFESVCRAPGASCLFYDGATTSAPLFLQCPGPQCSFPVDYYDSTTTIDGFILLSGSLLVIYRAPTYYTDYSYGTWLNAIGMVTVLNGSVAAAGFQDCAEPFTTQLPLTSEKMYYSLNGADPIGRVMGHVTSSNACIQTFRGNSTTAITVEVKALDIPNGCSVVVFEGLLPAGRVLQNWTHNDVVPSPFLAVGAITAVVTAGPNWNIVGYGYQFIISTETFAESPYYPLCSNFTAVNLQHYQDEVSLVVNPHGIYYPGFAGYPPHLRCSWLVSVPSDLAIKLVGLPNIGDDDFLTIYNGPTTTSPVVLNVSATTGQFQTFSANEMLLIFQAGNAGPVNAVGNVVMFVTVVSHKDAQPLPIPHLCSGVTKVFGRVGSVVSPYVILDDGTMDVAQDVENPPNLVCRFDFDAPPGFAYEFTGGLNNGANYGDHAEVYLNGQLMTHLQKESFRVEPICGNLSIVFSTSNRTTPITPPSSPGRGFFGFSFIMNPIDVYDTCRHAQNLTQPHDVIDMLIMQAPLPINRTRSRLVYQDVNIYLDSASGGTWVVPDVVAVRGDFVFNSGPVLGSLNMRALRVIGGYIKGDVLITDNDLHPNLPYESARFGVRDLGPKFGAAFPALELACGIQIEHSVDLAFLDFPVLGNPAFSEIVITDCILLESITMPVTKTINDLGFSNLRSLTTLTMDNLTQLNSLAITDCPLFPLDGVPRLSNVPSFKMQNAGVRSLSVGFDFVVFTISGCNSLRALSFPVIHIHNRMNPQSIYICENYLLADVNLGQVWIPYKLKIADTRATKLSFPSLVTMQQTFELISNLLLEELDMPVACRFQMTLQKSQIKVLRLPALQYTYSMQIFDNPSLTAFYACGARGYFNFQKCPKLSCSEIQRMLSGASVVTGGGSPTDCSADIGTFGCQSNYILSVDTAYCGFTVACIQSAISAAYSGQNATVLVPAGIYYGCSSNGINLLGKTLTLQGNGTAQDVVVDCQGVGRALSIVSGEGGDTIISDISFRNGTGDYGGLVAIVASYPLIRRCTFSWGTASYAGGAIGIRDVLYPVTLLDCTVMSSSAPTGGGVYVSTAVVTLERVTVIDNTAETDAGGIALIGTVAPTAITNCVIRNNRAARGGGCYADSALSMVGGIISDNTATDFGGGLAAVPDEVLTDFFNISDVVISNNYAGGGGGLFGYSANFVLLRVNISNNMAGKQGGAGLSATCSDNYRILCDITQPCDIVVHVVQSNFSDNTAVNSVGGGILLSNVEGVLADVGFNGNAATSGGGVYATVANLQVRTSHWIGNAAQVAGGAAFCEPFTGICDVSTSSFLENSASITGGAIYFCTAACPNSNATGNVDYTLVPNVFIANAFGNNAVGSAGYGPDAATDPTRLTYSVPPLAEAVSGHSVSADGSILTVQVADGFHQRVTQSTTSALTLSLAVFSENGVDSADTAVQLSGTQTALAISGVSTFPDATMIAVDTSQLDHVFTLVCRISELTTVSVGSPVTLIPCTPGDGRLSAAAVVTCDPCSAGSASTETTDYVCALCAPGSYASTAGSASCTPCPANTHAPVLGAVTCLACPVGFTASVAGSVDCSQDAITAGLSPAAVAGTVSGVIVAVLIAILVAALCLYRLQRRRTMQKYYLDNDATIRAGNTESPLQAEVKKILLANNTTRIGGGLFSNVYKAKYEGKWIALKVVKGEMATNGTAQQEFRREAVALSRLERYRHPGIIALQFYLQFNPMCIGVAYCNGGSLKRALMGGLFKEPVEKVRLATEAAAAFSLIHANDIVHLDIKTDNILLDDDMHVVIADFGIARVLGLGTKDPEMLTEFTAGATKDGNSSPHGSVSQLASGVSIVTNTSAYEAAFTVQYVDPIRILYDMNHDEPYLKRADIFSFAVLMWAIYSGVEPYSGEDPNKLLELLQDKPHTRPGAISNCPAFYSGLVERCWHASPSMRPTFPEIYDVLSTHLGSDYNHMLLPAYIPTLPDTMPTVPDPSLLATGRSSALDIESQLVTQSPPPPPLPPPSVLDTGMSTMPVAMFASNAPPPPMPPPPSLLNTGLSSAMDTQSFTTSVANTMQ